MDSFDQSLKYLLQQQPADFVRFALRHPTVVVLGPVPSGLPSRSRDIDGAYFIQRDGASEDAVHQARDAIEARTDLTEAQQADHLAVLWFIAEAEEVPVRVMKEYISEDRLMASTLYQSIFDKGEARGEERGDAKRCADTIIRILTRRVGMLDAAIATRIRSVTSLDTLDVWLNEALDLPDADGARRWIEKIGKTSHA